MRLHERVYVYRNLHRDAWSLRVRGRVVAHEECVVLLNAEFKVGEKSRKRAVREKRRNVHAFVVGKYDHADVHPNACRGGIRVRYNPFKGPHFTDRRGRAVLRALLVAMLGDGRVYAFGPEFNTAR